MNTSNEVLQISLADIIPNQFQPRVNFDENELQELSNSIKEHGIIQPLVLRKMGNKYEIIAGERRYRAAGMAGLTTVPAIISNIDDQASAEVALVENVQRKDLTAIEEARSYKNILDKGYLTQEQLAKKMGISQPAIANKLRLLNLDEEVQQALLNGQISERHARSLLALENKDDQKRWLNRTINERLTVRQLDMEIKKEQGEKNESVPLVTITRNVDDIKNKATDINPNNKSEHTFFNFDNQAPRPTDEKKELTDKPQNKFFNFLEDESANLNTLSGDDSIFNATPPDLGQAFNLQSVSAPTPPSPQQNKFINIPNDEPVIKIDDTPAVEETKDSEEEEPELETLFDPMENVDMLDPDYEKKQIENAGLDLSSAITQARDAIDQLKEKGFKIDTEEIDLDKEYQIIIKIEK